jgi:peroxiredoxin
MNCRKLLTRLVGWSRDLPEARVALVLCQNREAVAGFFDAEEVPYQVLVDESRDVARAYGVHVLLGLDSINIARPACFVIGRDRVVRYVFVSSHQWEPAEDAPVHEAVVALR